MLKYYLWALAEKIALAVPFGEEFAYGADYLMTRNSRGKSPPPSSFRLARKAKELIPQGGVVLDVGTGWFHHDAFLIYLLGNYTIYLFDIKDKARLRFIKNYLGYLLSNQELVCSELGISQKTIQSKLFSLLSLNSRSDIYKKCNFVPCIVRKTDEPFLPECSVDFMVSNCVLNHIPPHVLVPELHALRRMLKMDGYMYFLLGHDDHWTFHDRKANMFNYYRYSNAYYRLFFENDIEFQNRMVKQEWINLFHDCHLSVKECWPYITEKSRSEITRLCHIDSRFAKYPLEDLAAMYDYVLLQRVQ